MIQSKVILNSKVFIQENASEKLVRGWRLLCLGLNVLKAHILFGFSRRQRSGPRFNIKMTSYWYRKSHCGDKTILRPSYLHNGISYTGKTTSLYWIGAQAFQKPAFQHSNYSASTGAGNAVDGNASTYAQSNFTSNPGWYVDLGEFVLVDYLQVTHPHTQGEFIFNSLTYIEMKRIQLSRVALFFDKKYHLEGVVGGAVGQLTLNKWGCKTNTVPVPNHGQ